LVKAKKQGGRPKQTEVQQRIDHLLEVATRLFTEQGYSATTIEGVAKAARAGKQTIYSRFPNKKALFLEVVRRSLENQLFDVSFENDLRLSLEEGLFEWANYILKSALHPQFLGLYKFLLSEGPRFPEIPEAFSNASSSRYRSQLEQYIEKKRPKGRLYYLSSQDVTRVFLYLMNGYIIRYALENWPLPTAEQIAAHAREASTLLLHGMIGSKDTTRGK
jgi:AcrR family transcriptional regulator